MLELNQGDIEQPGELVEREVLALALASDAHPDDTIDN
jgi:hypothetical protein